MDSIEVLREKLDRLNIAFGNQKEVRTMSADFPSEINKDVHEILVEAVKHIRLTTGLHDELYKILPFKEIADDPRYCEYLSGRGSREFIHLPEDHKTIIKGFPYPVYFGLTGITNTFGIFEYAIAKAFLELREALNLVKNVQTIKPVGKKEVHSIDNCKVERGTVSTQCMYRAIKNKNAYDLLSKDTLRFKIKSTKPNTIQKRINDGLYSNDVYRIKLTSDKIDNEYIAISKSYHARLSSLSR